MTESRGLRFSTWVEVVGLIAVTISLALVAWELNQSNSLAKAQVYSDITHHLNEGNLMLADSPDLASLYQLLSDPETKLSEVDSQRAMGLALWSRNVWINSERAYREGWISENKFQAQLNDVEFTAKTWPGLNPYLRRAVQAFEENRELSEIEQRILEVTTR